jgi:two-component system, NarL family, sensor histidine kinase DesK
VTPVADAGATALAGDASRRASVLAATVLCLLLFRDLVFAADPVFGGEAAQVPFVVALFVVPLLFAFGGPRMVLARYRWLVLAVQGVLTWAPFAVFGGRWQVGVGGLLAGLVLVTVPGLASWLAAGALLAADVAVRVGIVGLPASFAPAWLGALWAPVVFTDLGLAFFGLVRLAQLVGDLQQAQGRHAELAVAAERLHAADALQSAIGGRLDSIAATAWAARRALAGDPGAARAQVTAAGSSAREAAAQARAVTVGRRGLPQPEPAVKSPSGVAIGVRLAWAVVVVVLCGSAAATVIEAANAHIGPRLATFLAVGIVVSMALQLRHSWAARQGAKPPAWPLTLMLQAAVVYAFFLPPLRVFTSFSLFLAGSVLLLMPGRWRWAGYAAVIVSWAALYATVPLHGNVMPQPALTTVYEAGSIAATGLLVYGLSRLAGMARELEAVRGELAAMAAVRERLRVTRDVHDLLGLGLSAIALKADLIGKLIGRDDTRAAAEISELGRTCAAARADIRLVTGDGQKLSLAGELAAASQILASAGIQVHTSIPAGPLPAAADQVLAVVLREAVTNILRHAAATSCTIEATTAGATVRLTVTNNGVTDPPGPPREGDRAGAGGGSGLANLTTRVQATGGQLSASHAGGRFELTAQIPLHHPPGAGAVTGPAQAPPGSLGAGRPAGDR